MSILKVNAVQNTSGTEMYLARAWVNFNGTGTVAIRASGNVTSITDNGVGDYTVNFTTALSDANYATVVTTGQSGISACGQVNETTAQTTSARRVFTTNSGSTAAVDCTTVNVAVFR